jgi:geranylgeranyl diphosphate synthase, type I
MEFLKYLKNAASEIEKELEVFFKIWRQNAEKINSMLLPLIDASIEACKGGKRIRGALVKLGYELAQPVILSGSEGSQDPAGDSSALPQNDKREVLKASAAYEIFQTAILAHDDIIDKSELRRARPTIFKKLGGDHYATSQTICLGDIGFFQAIEIISGTNFNEKAKNEAIKSFSQTMTETALGQMLDIEIPSKNLPRKEKDALTIFHLKTARYTITGPLLLGAILGEGKPELLEKIKEFGDNLGIAFQIQDDILGVFGTEKELGKSVSSDIEEGKQTLLITKALEVASPQQKQILTDLYGKPEAIFKEVEEIRKIFKDTGALDYSRSLALEYVDKAKKVISELTSNPGLEKILNQMAVFLVERKK